MYNRGSTLLLAILIIFAATILFCGIFYFVHLAIAPAQPKIGGAPTGQSTPVEAVPSSTPSTTTVQAPAPSLGIDPQDGPVGALVTIHGSGFGLVNTIEMGGLTNASLRSVSSPDGSTLIFTVPKSLGPNCKPGQACPQFILVVTPRTYPITVITNGVSQNVGTFTVTGR